MKAFDLFLETSKGLKARKYVTDRIVTQQDIGNLLFAVEREYSKGEIDLHHFNHCKALVLFSALAGQRPRATIDKITVQQFKEAIQGKKPVLDILPEQDKIRMEHYCPLHPQVVENVAPLLVRRPDNEPFFQQLSF